MNNVNEIKQINKRLVIQWLPIRPKDTYKNQLGRVLCIGGNENMGGAIILAGGAALASGAGLVTVASHPVNRTALHSHFPEIMFTDYHSSDHLEELIAGSDTILIGPGLGRDHVARQLVHRVIELCSKEQYLIIDADGLYHLSLLIRDNLLLTRPKNLILTPHLGEWKQLTGLEPSLENYADNQKWQVNMEAIVILKKERTEVYLEEQIWENTAGNPSMSTGGMGDTLAGMIAGLIGQYDNKNQAILSGVFLHSYIADELAKTHYVTLPHLIIQHIPQVMARFQSEKEGKSC